MSVGYMLVNATKKELVTFAHLPVNTAREIAGNPVAAAITAWYLLANPGDQVAFVSDTYGEWPFQGSQRDDMRAYTDVTSTVVAELVDVGIVRDDGIEWQDPEDPGCFMRKVTHVWMAS